LSKTDLINDWRGVVIYPNRQRESQNTKRYQELLDFGRLQRVYLHELENLLETSPTLATVQLIVSEDSQAVARATNLIQRVRQEIDDANQQRELLELKVFIIGFQRHNKLEQ
jgi:predicted transposase YdaD